MNRIHEIRNLICNKIYVEREKEQPVCDAMFLLFSSAGSESDAETKRSVLVSKPTFAQFNDGSMNDSEEFLVDLCEARVNSRNGSFCPLVCLI